MNNNNEILDLIYDEDNLLLEPIFYNNDLALRVELETRSYKRTSQRIDAVLKLVFNNQFPDLVCEHQYEHVLTCPRELNENKKMDTLPRVAKVHLNFAGPWMYKEYFGDEHAMIRSVNRLIYDWGSEDYGFSYRTFVKRLKRNLNRQTFIHYFVSIEHNCLLFFYDHRGVDILCGNQEAYNKMYDLLYDYLFDYDMEIMNARLKPLDHMSVQKPLKPTEFLKCSNQVVVKSDV